MYSSDYLTLEYRLLNILCFPWKMLMSLGFIHFLHFEVNLSSDSGPTISIFLFISFFHGNVDWCSYLENSIEVPQKQK